MSFPEIFEYFKNNFYIRRESFEDGLFIQLVNIPPVNIIRSVKFEEYDNIDKAEMSLSEKAYYDRIRPQKIVIVDPVVRLSGDDLIADDWVIKK